MNRIGSLSLVILLVMPTVTAACPIDFRRIGPLKLQRSDVRAPVSGRTTRAAWGLGPGWTATTPEINQQVVTRAGRVYHGFTFAKQRAISIDAVAPDGNGWRYEDDDDPSTPPCAMAGESEWQQPIVRVREDRRRVRVLAAVQRTVGDSTGCVLGTDDDDSWECPTMVRTVIRLKRPLGNRRLVLERFR